MRRIGLAIIDPGAIAEKIGGWRQSRVAEQAKRISELRADLDMQGLAQTAIQNSEQNDLTAMVADDTTAEVFTPEMPQVSSYSASDVGRVQPRTAALYLSLPNATSPDKPARLATAEDIDLFHEIVNAVRRDYGVSYERISIQLHTIGQLVLGGSILPDLTNTPNAAIFGEALDLLLDRLLIRNKPLHDKLMASREGQQGK